jgi:predicted 3-demethylubiquinone-9 3-methyltransferase (glyoxalase superfamily)
MFTQEHSGQAPAAIDYWTSIFPNSSTQSIQKLPDGPASVLGDFSLAGHDFRAMDAGDCHQFVFSCALSMMIELGTQQEIDSFWEKLSAVPEAANCGWCKDRFGVTWRVVPQAMGEMLATGNDAQRLEVTSAFKSMKSLNWFAPSQSLSSHLDQGVHSQTHQKGPV